MAYSNSLGTCRVTATTRSSRKTVLAPAGDQVGQELPTRLRFAPAEQARGSVVEADDLKIRLGCAFADCRQGQQTVVRRAIDRLHEIVARRPLAHVEEDQVAAPPISERQREQFAGCDEAVEYATREATRRRLRLDRSAQTIAKCHAVVRFEILAPDAVQRKSDLRLDIGSRAQKAEAARRIFVQQRQSIRDGAETAERHVLVERQCASLTRGVPPQPEPLVLWKSGGTFGLRKHRQELVGFHELALLGNP